jgi:transcriptional regulator with XRE-family HTH domain
MTGIQVVFGRQVRKHRLLLGISQERLAHLAGLDRTYIGGIERGERNPSLRNISKIAKALDVEMGVLFSGLGAT